MAASENRDRGGDFPDDKFLSQLDKKTEPLPFSTEPGNQCVRIDTRNCSQAFRNELECFISAHGDHLRLVARGIDCYLEILGRETCAAAYRKSAGQRKKMAEH